jgi:hypothetical protein
MVPYYLGKYLFTRELVLTAKVKDISLLDLALMLEKDRVKFNKNKPLNSLSKSVLLVNINNNKIEIFECEDIYNQFKSSSGNVIDFMITGLSKESL